MDPKLRLVDPEAEPLPEKREPTENERAAAEVMALLEQAAARIPGLEAPHPDSARSVRGARTIPRKYIVSMIDTIEGHETLGTGEFVDTVEGRDTLEYNDVFQPVAQRMAVLLKSLNYTMEARLARLVHRLLGTYRVAQGLASFGHDPKLAARLEILARLLNRRKKHRKSEP